MTISDQIIYGDANSVKAVMQQVRDVDFIDEYGYTPLIQTAIVNNVEMMEAVLAAGADVDMPDLTGRTALHWAVDNQNQKMVKVLLAAKANPNRYTIASQPVLSKPILRHDPQMKSFLVEHGASSMFANDYINAKLLGHRFELSGFVDIVDANGYFTELSYEGFVLEFTLDVIQASLTEFKKNYAARHLSDQFFMLDIALCALKRGMRLTRFQNYLLDLKGKTKEINHLLQQDPLVIPVGQEGHAITIVRHGQLMAICDRAEQEDPNTPTVEVFYMNRPARLTAELCVPLIFKHQTLDAVKATLKQALKLQSIGHLDLPKQLMGNCSWANVEASIPTLILLYGMHQAQDKKTIKAYRQMAKQIFRQWQEWDKERALQFCLQDFDDASDARKAAKVTILAAIFTQSCRATNEFELTRAKKIFPYLKTPGYEYVLKTYMHTYIKRKSDHPIGRNLKSLLVHCDLFAETDAWLS
jgi:hypothetical protein